MANANWQRHGKGRKPKPLPRPGDKTKTRIGTTSMSVDELEAALADPSWVNDGSEEVS